MEENKSPTNKCNLNKIFFCGFHLSQLEILIGMNTFGEALGAVCDDAVDHGQDVCERVAWGLRLAAFKGAKEVSTER